MRFLPILHTDRCVLSPVSQNDIPELQEILDDEETKRFLPELCNEFKTEESLLLLIKSFDAFLLEEEGFFWTIKRNDILIGFIAIMDIKTNATLFYAMHPYYRNLGFMRESLADLIQFVRKNSICQKLQTEVHVENAISQKLLISLGFNYSRTKQLKKIFVFVCK